MADIWQTLQTLGPQISAMNNPNWAKLQQDQQLINMKLQQQQALQNLAMRYSQGSVGPMGPQKPMSLDSLVGEAAGITGDIDPLVQLSVSREKLKAEQDRRSALRNATFGNQMPQQAQQEGPLSVRNNNPGNMRPLGQTQGFQQFETPQDGLAAMEKDLTAKITGNSPAMAARFGAGYSPTLSNVISTWAPPEENDTQNYVDFVSGKTGIAPDQVLSPMDVKKIMPAMIEMEGGKDALQAFTGVPQAEQQPIAPPQNPVMQQLAQRAAIDPEQYGDDYLYAQIKQADDATKAEEQKAKAAREDKKNLTEGERELRKEFEGLPDVKQFREVESSYKRINKAATNNSAAGDIALIFNYMKMLDPGSTVREGEFATAQNAAGIPTQIWNVYNKAVSGERLAPEQRQDFLSQAKEQYLGAQELFDVRANQYEDLASAYEFNPKRIVTRARQKVETPKTQAANAPMQGGWDDAKERRYQELISKRGGG